MPFIVPTTYTTTPANAAEIVDTAHSSFPMTFDPATGIGVDEQDSLAEVFSAVKMIVACPLGAWPEQPQFGIPSVLGAQAPLSTASITQAITRLEPRATAVAAEYADALSDAIRHVNVDVSTVQTDQ